MISSVHPLTRPLLILSALVLLIGVLIQPATFSHAQAGDPPPSTATAGPTAAPQRNGPVSQPHAVIRNPDGTLTFQGSEAKPWSDGATPDKPEPAPIGSRAAEPQPEAPRQPSDQATELHTRVAPQQVQTGFQVNIVSSATTLVDKDLTYTIFFTNTASTAYNNVLLQDGIGAGQFYRGCGPSYPPATCIYTVTGDIPPQNISINESLSNGEGTSSGARQIVWNLGTVQPNQKGSIKYTVRVQWDLFPRSKEAARVLGNTVALYQDGEINSNNLLNQDEWGVLIVGPVFHISKTAPAGPVLQGDRINFELTLGNATLPEDQFQGAPRRDAVTATQIQLIDAITERLPQIDPASLIIQNGGTYNATKGWVVWNLANPLPPGQSVTVSFSGVVRNDLTQCDTIRNRGWVTSAQMPLYTNGEKVYIEGQVETSTILYAPAYVTTSVTPNRVHPGETATWTVSVANYWKTAINGATIKFYFLNDQSNPPFEYVSSSSTGAGAGSYDAPTNSVTWQNVNIPVKSSFTVPGKVEFSIVGRARKYLDGNRGLSVIATLPAGIPMGCLRNTDAGITVDPWLLLDKTVDKNAVLSGADVVYSIDIYNYAAQPVNDATIVDTMPIGRIFNLIPRAVVYKAMVLGPAPSITGPDPQTETPQVLTWSNIQVPAAQGTTPGKTSLRFTATANGYAPTCRNNRVGADSSLSQVRQFDGATVCFLWPWGVEKTASRTVIPPRDASRRLDFTITYVNFTSTPQRIIPGDFLAFAPPYNIRFVSMITGPAPDNGGIPDSNGYITWPEVTLGANATLVYKYTAEMPYDPDTGLIYVNTFCNRGILWPVDWDYGEYEEECIVVSSIDLVMSKEVQRSNVGLGELLTFNISLENKSPEYDVAELVVSDTLPINMTYVGPYQDSPAAVVTTLPNGQQRLNWSGILVTKNATRHLTFLARAPGLINQYRNTAVASGGTPLPALICNHPTDGFPGCNSGITVNVSNLITIKPEVSPASIAPGELTTFTVSVVNVNDLDYTNTTVTDTLPLGFSFVSMVDGPAPYQPRQGVLVWSGQTVPKRTNVDGKLVFSFQARAPLSYGSFRSKVEASSPIGIIPTVDNAARVLITPPTPALSLVAPSLVEVGSDVIFRISLVNPLATPLTGLTINHLLPDSFVYLGVETGTPTPTINLQTLTWTGVTVPAHADDGTPGIVELFVRAKAPDTEGTATSTATVSGGSTPIDQTYNRVDIIVAELRYIYLPIVSIAN
jgi:uncharacterized repeat protein (TIGR01451 family)